MSSAIVDNEELIDYEDDQDIAPHGAAAPAPATNGAAAHAADKDKKNFTGIHSTGFRSVNALPAIDRC